MPENGTSKKRKTVPPTGSSNPMPLTDPPPYAFHRKFVDFDELAEEAHHGDLDLFQHGRGAFRGELVQFGIRNIHISEARFCRPLLQKGTPPAGLRTIAVPAHQKVHLSWRGMQVSGNDLMIFPRGGELAATSNLDFHVYTCSFPEILLTSFNDEFGPSELDDLRGDASVLHCRTSAIQSVRECLSQLSATMPRVNSQTKFYSTSQRKNYRHVC